MEEIKTWLFSLIPLPPIDLFKQPASPLNPPPVNPQKPTKRGEQTFSVGGGNGIDGEKVEDVSKANILSSAVSKISAGARGP